MNRIFDDLLEIVIGLLGAAALAILLYVFEVFSFKYLITFVVPGIIIIVATRLIINRYRKIGLWSWKLKKTHMDIERALEKNATNSVDILVTENIFEVAKNDKFIKRIKELATQNIRVRILIPKPYSEASQYYSKDTTGINQNIEKLLRNLVDIKNKTKDRTMVKDLKIGVYDDPIHWCGVFVDNKTANVELCSESTEKKRPSLKLRPVNNQQTYFDAFLNSFNITWQHARRLFTSNDVDRIIHESIKRQSNGIIIAITGPSGAGKTTLTKQLLLKGGRTFSTIRTYTTRKPRSQNENQNQYTFVSMQEFLKLSDQHEFVVSADFCGNKYGITYDDVFGIIDSKKDLLLDTIAHPMDLKNAFGNRVVIIYITGPSNQEMAKRISNRGTTGEDLRNRIENMINQVELAKYCDYIVVNENVDSTLDILKTIVNEAKQEYIETGDIVSEKILSYTVSEAIDHGALPNDEVLYEQL